MSTILSHQPCINLARTLH